MQTLIAYLIVFVALLYALWLLLPHAVFSRLTALLIHIVPPSQRSRFAHLQASAQSAGCSTCKGCATDAKASPARDSVRLHRR